MSYWHALMFDNLPNDFFTEALGETVIEADSRAQAEELAYATFESLGDAELKLTLIGDATALVAHYERREHELRQQMQAETDPQKRHHMGDLAGAMAHRATLAAEAL